MIVRSSILAMVATLLAGVATAKEIPLEDRYFMWFLNGKGNPAVLNFYWPEVLPLQAQQRSPEDVAQEFTSLCLDTGLDQAKFVVAAKASNWSWSFIKLANTASKSAGAFPLDLWRTNDATVQFWNGNANSFAKLPFYQLSWGVMITGYVDSRRGTKGSNIAPQCNFRVHMKSVDEEAVAARISQIIGVSPTYQQSNKKTATATWANSRLGSDVIVAMYIERPKKLDPILRLGIVKPLP